MGKALYRSYRSKSFDEVIGQEHITTTLKNSLNAGTYSHAYLLTGPRGVGKTSIARILAHAVNKVDYPADPAYIDIIEIDAASNRRIDEIRELRERVTVAPTSLKYKVYIIDEVHMLTREAFNALLKTLEEPPGHAIFILATTDVHKVPDTIVSRCLRFHFRPIDHEGITNHLSNIAKNESIKIDDSALQIIAEHSEGSFRDAIALLDQIRSHDSAITSEYVERVLGLGSKDLISQIFNIVMDGDVRSLLEILTSARSRGVSERRLVKQLIEALRNEIHSSEAKISVSEAIELIDNLIQVPSQHDVRAALEIALLKSTVKNTSIKPAANTLTPPPEVSTADPPPEHDKPAQNVSLQQPTIEPIQLESNQEFWEQILEELKQENRSLYGIARMATAEVTNTSLILTFQFAFHQKQVNQTKNKKFINDVVLRVNPSIETVEIRLDQSTASTKVPDKAIANITNIFGGSEMLES